MRHAVPPTRTLACLAVALALALAGCGDKSEGVARRADGSAMDPLPTPEGARGSVTGMPAEPGPGQPEDNASLVDPDAIVMDDGSTDAGGDVALDGQDDATATEEPSAGDAVEAVQRYYDAIQSHDFAGAYALWGDGGRASGQSADQFAAGFADTANVVVTVDAPVHIEGAMGSRFVEIPVAVEATARDGRVRRYVGAYTLQRSVVEGATPDQRSWRIASADLRELTQ
jgi:hypothetical protein